MCVFPGSAKISDGDARLNKNPSPTGVREAHCILHSPLFLPLLQPPMSDHLQTHTVSFYKVCQSVLCLHCGKDSWADQFPVMYHLHYLYLYHHLHHCSSRFSLSVGMCVLCVCICVQLRLVQDVSFNFHVIKMWVFFFCGCFLNFTVLKICSIRFSTVAQQCTTQRILKSKHKVTTQRNQAATPGKCPEHQGKTPLIFLALSTTGEIVMC